MLDLLSSYPVTLRWVEMRPGRFIPAIRNRKLELIEEFEDYAAGIATKLISRTTAAGAYKSRMEPIGYALFELARYLDEIGICKEDEGFSWRDVDDGMLEDFRDWSLEAIQSKVTSKDESTAKKTANIKLRIIYNYYAWAEVTAALTEGKIGWSTIGRFSITSTLPDYLKKPDKWNSKRVRRYPLCFEGIGEKSRTMDGQYWATESDLDDIEDYFWRSCTTATAERNILFMRIADQTGFRRGSINSLTSEQFSGDAINNSLKQELPTHVVRPAKQKLGKCQYLDVPYPLAWEINRYAKQLAECGPIDEGAKSSLFVSVITGKAITDSHWSDIFTDAFREIGAPRGSGIHSVRRKFAEDWFRKEIERREKTSLPIAYEDIVANLARVLGHDSKLSQEAYRRVTVGLQKENTEDRLENQNRQNVAEILRLKSELARKDKVIESLMHYPVVRKRHF